MKATERWGWDMMRRVDQWPIRILWLKRLFNDIGNYGLRGTLREGLRSAFYFGTRGLLLYKLGGRHPLGLLLYFVYRRRGWKFYAWELTYSAGARCKGCGAGLAYPRFGIYLPRMHSVGRGLLDAWNCSAVLTGVARYESPTNPLLTVSHDALPWMMYDVKSEDQVCGAPGRTRAVLWGLLGYRYPTNREAGITTRPK